LFKKPVATGKTRAQGPIGGFGPFSLGLGVWWEGGYKEPDRAKGKTERGVNPAIAGTLGTRGGKKKIKSCSSKNTANLLNSQKGRGVFTKIPLTEKVTSKLVCFTPGGEEKRGEKDRKEKKKGDFNAMPNNPEDWVKAKKKKKEECEGGKKKKKGRNLYLKPREEKHNAHSQTLKKRESHRANRSDGG